MSFSRRAYAALIEEAAENTPLKPTSFFGFVKFDLVTKWGVKNSSNIFADRNLMINAIKDAVEAPTGKLGIEVEPKFLGFPLKAVFGSPSTGRFFKIYLRMTTGAVTGTPVAGATLTQASTGATATVVTVVDATHLDLRSITVGFNASNLVTGTNPDGTTFTFTPAATLPVPNWTVGETVTGQTSAATATVVAVSAENDYLLMSAPTGTFTAAGEALVGGSSSSKATLGVNASTVYGHEFKAPQNTLPTYTLEIGYENEAVRFMGVRFPSLDSITDKDNIINATIGVFARSAFICARVQGAVAAGSSKTILLDQTLGLTTSDTVKVFRPRTGLYLDFSGSGVKTSAISSIVAETSITVATLQTALEAGDLIVLAPQTPSYSVQKEFAWIGGAIGRTGDSITSAIANAASASAMETADFNIMNETESRHAANATTVAGRFPTYNALKGFKATGKFKRAYQDMTFIDRLRNSTQTGVQVAYTGGQIASTGVYYTLDLRFPNGVLSAYHPGVEVDALLDEDIPLEFFRDTSAGYTAKALLVTDTASY